MHGRPRLPVGQSHDNVKDQGKAAQLKLLVGEVIQNHQDRCYTKEALKKSAQLVEFNPEVYTAWNYRKRAVQHLMDLEEDETARKQIAEDELRLVERALQVNLKSYGAWYHRKWIINLGLSSLDHEFLLLQHLLKKDSRNFHGWNHRRFAVKTNNVSAEKELEYATEKINENFSNYSAWHYRSTLLSLLVKEGMSKEEILKNEYGLVNQAYFTEPDDQSAWVYNSWLLGETKGPPAAQLLGTWPEDGSTIFAHWGKQSSLVFVSSRNPLGKEYSFCSNGVPVVLSFSEAIANVTVKVSSKPELGHLSDVCWRPLSTLPSKIWVADLPIQGCRAADYALSLESSSPGAEGHSGIKFNLQVTSGGGDWEDGISLISSNACKDALWPSMTSFEYKEGKKLMSDEEEQANNEADPGDTLLSQEFEQKPGTALDKEDWQQRLLEEQIQNLRELLELEENSKWTRLTLSRVLVAHGALTRCPGQYTNQVLDLLKGLSQSDPVHRDYYQSLFSSTFIAKVLRNPKSLMQLWYDPHTTDVNGVETASWLRWNGLSLSKFDSVEQLLWVQRLDLSHNELLTVQGLEELQLLVALDISYNRIPQVTALANLRHNPRLQFLNIAHNEIGSHPVDCARYSFPSVLTNEVKLSSLEEQGEHHWEVHAVFGGMDLRAIEIVGNAVANNQAFRAALLLALPSLELLDGDEVHAGH